jgi:hypothetical protein
MNQNQKIFEKIKILSKIPKGVYDGGLNKNNLIVALMME